MHAKANRVLITAIEEYDESNSAIYVRHGETPFEKASAMISDSVEAKTNNSTRP